jgi:autotransporter-associated beta strand protein
MKSIRGSFLRFHARTFVLSAAILLLVVSARNTTLAGSATWNSNPNSDKWNQADNWTPATVPNGPTDIATFGISTQTIVGVGGDGVEVDSIVFNSGASAFTILEQPLAFSNPVFILGGAGIVNNSGIGQNFEVRGNPKSANFSSTLEFTNSASVGISTSFIVYGGMRASGTGSFMNFFDSSSANSAVITNEGGADFNATGGGTYFLDNATAASATVVTNGGTKASSFGGITLFGQNATADHATLITNGTTASNGTGGVAQFYDASTAAEAMLTANGSSKTGRAKGGTIQFFLGSTAANATLIANSGTDGGESGSIQFADNSSGGTARIELFGSGNLDISSHSRPSITTGSLEGDGLVFLGAEELSVGSSGLSTTFSGVIQDGGMIGRTGGSLSKIGTGTLTLTGENLYTGGTTVSGGGLVVSNTAGSGTGLGPVQINAGTLGGGGIVAGAVTVGTGSGAGASLEPSIGASRPATVTVQSGLTFKSDATYSCKLNSRQAKADQVIANGVTVDSGAQFSMSVVGRGILAPGTVFRVISNTSAIPIGGTFTNLPDGSTFIQARNKFQVSYEGGDGNDLTLTVVP